jgi:hypothetical protein
MTVSSSVEAWRLRDAGLCGLVAWRMYRYPYLFIVIHITSTAAHATKGTTAVGQGDVAFLAGGVPTAFSRPPGGLCASCLGCQRRFEAQDRPVNNTCVHHLLHYTRLLQLARLADPARDMASTTDAATCPLFSADATVKLFCIKRSSLAGSLADTGLSQVADVVKALGRSPPVVIPCESSIADAWKASNRNNKACQRTKATPQFTLFVLLRRFLRTPRCCRRRSRRRAEATTA